MKPQPRLEFGSYQAFGHDGAGGALGFAEPELRHVVRIHPHADAVLRGADDKSVELSQVARQCIRQLS